MKEDVFFKCLICGEVRSNTNYIRYPNFEKYGCTIAEALADLEKYKSNIEPACYALSSTVLGKLPLNKLIYRFTVCHGYFERTKGKRWKLF